MSERREKLRRILRFGLAIGLVQAATAFSALGAAPPQTSSQTKTASTAANAQAIFQRGQEALQRDDLEAAEVAFQKVIAVDPRAASAYSNLGVIAMRRKQWERALTLLKKAERLSPGMAGIRLNIGLAEYRSGNYAAAIAPLSSVVRDQPDSQQARYLLGLCNVFIEHYSDAVDALEPLWPQMSSDFLYLYVLDIAAHSAGQTELDEKALGRLVEVGGNTPEFHLILGKAYLNREEFPKAIEELQRAAEGNPNLPFAHFEMGMVYVRSNEYERAEAEFRKDIAVEADLADNYEQLGKLYLRMNREEEAEKAFGECLQRDKKRGAAQYGLAKIYMQQKKYEKALTALTAAEQSATNMQSIHILRGQVLMRLGRKTEAQAEIAKGQKEMDAALTNKRQMGRSEDRAPNPELTQPPQ
jgi:tetratricopeptide (TPR) repeat protein